MKASSDEVKDETASQDAMCQVGQRRYRIRQLNASSDKYGACEVCQGRVADVHHQVEEKFYRHQTPPHRTGWTHADCCDLFGHEACLKGRRGGQYLRSMTEDGLEYDVHAGADTGAGGTETTTAADLQPGAEIQGSCPDYRLPGAMVRRLMRKREITIRALAQKYGITMKRVREVRANGVRGFLASEWHFMLTGVWLDGVGEKTSAK